jgi:uncharacterized protein
MSDLGNELDEELEDELGDDDDDDVDEDDDDAGNRLTGASARAVLAYVAKALVDDPEAVVVEADERGRSLTLRLHAAPDDLGRLIGRRGRVAQSIRAVVRAAGARDGVDASVDIVD